MLCTLRKNAYIRHQIRMLCISLLFMELRFQEKIFHSKRMPFYMFGDTIYLGKIPEADWVSYICSRFNKAGITISKGHAEDICRRVECYSSYVQQLAPLNEFCP